MRAMYDDFLPLQKEILKQDSDVIPGIPEAIAELRRQKIRIGSTTGYTRALIEIVNNTEPRRTNESKLAGRLSSLS